MTLINPYSSRQIPDQPSLRILLSGGSGLVGGLLKPSLVLAGHRVDSLVRCMPRANQNEIQWDPLAGTIDSAALEGADAAIHLSGENIAVRWTAARKQRFFDSRVRSADTLCQALAKLQKPPRVLIAASAIGFYGDRGDEVVDEDSPAGTGYLPEMCQAWEAATAPAKAAGIRVVNLRIGVVLSYEGGALAKMITPFRLGLGGPLGSGRQWISWISADDLIRVIYKCLTDDAINGPVNAVAPTPVRQKEFAKTLASALHRPAVLPMPAAIVLLLFGEMGQTLLLASTRVEASRLHAKGFSFEQSDLRKAIVLEIQKPQSRSALRDDG
jgi:uncharacterized protein